MVAKHWDVSTTCPSAARLQPRGGDLPERQPRKGGRSGHIVVSLLLKNIALDFSHFDETYGKRVHVSVDFRFVCESQSCCWKVDQFWLNCFFKIWSVKRR